MIIDDLITVISTLPYPVSQARIDPFTVNQDALPAINVKYVSEQMSSMGHAPDFLVTTRLEVAVYVGETSTYYSAVKNIVEEVKEALLTDQHWFSEFRQVPNIDIHYEYSDGGETNYAIGRINIEVETTVSYQPNITTALKTAYLELDDTKPFDPNIGHGPDGVIEITAPIALPQ